MPDSVWFRLLTGQLDAPNKNTYPTKDKRRRQSSPSPFAFLLLRRSTENTACACLFRMLFCGRRVFGRVRCPRGTLDSPMATFLLPMGVALDRKHCLRVSFPDSIQRQACFRSGAVPKGHLRLANSNLSATYEKSTQPKNTPSEISKKFESIVWRYQMFS